MDIFLFSQYCKKKRKNNNNNNNNTNNKKHNAGFDYTFSLRAYNE